jgi:hypothetical protein
VPGLEDAAVDAPAEVLDEGAEQPAMGGSDGKVALENDVHRMHGTLRLDSGRVPVAVPRERSPAVRAGPALARL